MYSHENLLFAAKLLDAQRLSARQLDDVCQDWTNRDGQRLADRLVEVGLLNETECELMQSQIEATLERRQGDPDQSTVCDYDRARNAVDALNNIDYAQSLLDSIGKDDDTLEAGIVEMRTSHVSYRLMRIVGQGGLGRVWLARDENLNRDVAIKEVKPNLSHSDAAYVRFCREAEITGQLQHPNIVPVHELGHDKTDNRAFYAMRYVGKRNLADAIREYHTDGLDLLELHRLLGAFVSICQAVGYAHSRNVIHRDLKPANIALGEFGEVSVLDWGLAKRINRDELNTGDSTVEISDTASASQTQAGEILGTPAFMAPEQAKGDTAHIDARTDVYGLGAILYAILTGKAPHEPTQTSGPKPAHVVEMFRRITATPTPSARAVNPSIPPALDAICAKSMAKEPDDRYHRAADLADDVQRWLAGEPVAAYQEPWPQRMSRFLVKHRVLAQATVSLLIVILVTVTTLATYLWQNRETTVRMLMENMKLEGHEIEVALLSESRNLHEDTKFMSILPPIQGVIDSRAAGDSESEQVWRSRLATIYRGLLEANSEYVAVSFVGRADGGRELVHVERTGKRNEKIGVLQPKELEQSGHRDYIAETLGLKAGEVFLSDLKPRPCGRSGKKRTLLLMHAAVPIFSKSDGKLFGVVVIHMDAGEGFRGMLEAAAGSSSASAYITNKAGELVIHSESASDIALGEKRPDWIVNSKAQVSAFFSADNNEEEFSSPPAPDAPDLIFAGKVRFDPRQPEEHFGVVLNIPEEIVTKGQAPLRRQAFALGLLLITLTALCTWFVSRVLTRGATGGQKKKAVTSGYLGAR